MQVSQETGRMTWYSHLFKNFPQFSVIHTVKSFGIVNETEVDVFLKFPDFPYGLANVSNLISVSSFFSKPSLDMWKFFFHIMLKPSMQDFKHDLPRMGDECNCLMESTFFSAILLRNWDEDWSFPVLYKRTHSTKMKIWSCCLPAYNPSVFQVPWFKV